MSIIGDVGRSIANEIKNGVGFANTEYKLNLADELKNLGQRKICVVPSGFETNIVARRMSHRTYRFDVILLHKVEMRGGKPNETEVEDNFDLVESIVTQLETERTQAGVQLSESIQAVEVPEPLAEQMMNDASIHVAGITVSYKRSVKI